MITHNILASDLRCHRSMGVDCDKFSNCIECCEHTLSEYEDSIRAEAREKTIDEIIKMLSKSEDTILSDKQYYALIELKEQKNDV